MIHPVLQGARMRALRDFEAGSSGSGSGQGYPVNVDYGFPNIRFFPPPELFSSVV